MKYTYIKNKNKNNKDNKDKENNPKKKLKNRTKKHTKISIKQNNKSKLLHKTQKKQSQRQIGGSDNKHSNNKEKFEVHSLKNFDYDKYKISKGANIDWSSIGGPPPEPNCCIC